MAEAKPRLLNLFCFEITLKSVICVDHICVCHKSRQMNFLNQTEVNPISTCTYSMQLSSGLWKVQNMKHKLSWLQQLEKFSINVFYRSIFEYYQLNSTYHFIFVNETTDLLVSFVVKLILLACKLGENPQENDKLRYLQCLKGHTGC